MAAVDELNPVVQTKFYRPRAHHLIARPRLVARLAAVGPGDVALVWAPSGYGKSTIISQWLGPDQPTAWLSLDRGDDELASFVRYVAAAVEAATPGAGAQLREFLVQAVPSATLEAWLLNAFHGLDAPLTLVLDDYHVIDNPEVHQLTAALLEHTPRELRLVLSSRQRPPFELAKHRASGGLTELSMDELRFDLDETVDLLAHEQARASRADAELLLAQTEGWPLALRLSAQSLARSGGDGPGKAMTRDIRGHIHELIAAQPPELRAAIEAAAVVDRFCPALLEALLGLDSGGAQLQAALLASGLICVPLDDSGRWHRYHHLLHELLTEALGADQPERLTELHHRAARWFEAEGLLDDAFGHAWHAGGPELGAAVLLRNRDAILARERWHLLRKWMDRLPAARIAADPWLLLTRAWEVQSAGRYIELMPLLDQIEACSEGREDIAPELDAFRSLRAFFASRVDEAIALSERALARLPATNLLIRGCALTMRVAAYQLRGDIDVARRIVAEALREPTLERGSQLHSRLLLSLALAEWMHFDLDRLRVVADQAIALGRARDLHVPLGYGHHLRSMVAYMRDELDEAEAHAELVDRSVRLTHPQIYVESVLVRAAIALARAQPEAALAALDEVSEGLTHSQNLELLGRVEATRAQLALRTGRRAAACAWADAESGPLQPIHQFAAPELDRAAILLAEGSSERLTRAGASLDALEAFLRHTHSNGFLARVLVLQAIRRAREDQPARAQDALDEAVTLLLPGDAIRAVLDLAHIAPLPELLAASAQSAEPGDEREAFLERCLARLEPASPPAASPGESELTRREREVLTLLAERLTNKEIATQLSISPSTVKRHTENIYSKLMVHDRRAAVERAQQDGLLPTPSS